MGVKKTQNSKLKTQSLEFYFFALAVTGKGISGGDRIFIEFARQWGRKHKINIFTSWEGRRLCKKQNLSGKNIRIISINNKPLERFFLLNYLYKILSGIKLGLSLTINHQPLTIIHYPLSITHQPLTIIYSASDFWMDSLPAIILKLRFPKVIWAAAWYQTAPKPWIGYSEGERVERYNFKALLYWLIQQLVKPLISNFSDFV